MLIASLACAGLGFAFLVTALFTGAVVWAWLCIGACVLGGGALLASTLRHPSDDVRADEQSNLSSTGDDPAITGELSEETSSADDSATTE